MKYKLEDLQGKVKEIEHKWEWRQNSLNHMSSPLLSHNSSQIFIAPQIVDDEMIEMICNEIVMEEEEEEEESDVLLLEEPVSFHAPQPITFIELPTKFEETLTKENRDARSFDESEVSTDANESEPNSIKQDECLVNNEVMIESPIAVDAEP